MSEKDKTLNRLYLMVRNPNDIMKGYVWATHDELEMYHKQGYIRLNK